MRLVDVSYSYNVDCARESRSIEWEGGLADMSSSIAHMFKFALTTRHPTVRIVLPSHPRLTGSSEARVSLLNPI